MALSVLSLTTLREFFFFLSERYSLSLLYLESYLESYSSMFYLQITFIIVILTNHTYSSCYTWKLPSLSFQEVNNFQVNVSSSSDGEENDQGPGEDSHEDPNVGPHNLQ